jgi:hypothetical protein
MATLADIERLTALIGRLTPLTRVQPGAVIRAQDFSEIAGSLIEVARVSLAESDVATGVEPHEHPDQVKISWLEPSLRALIERGPLSDPKAAGQLDDLDRRLARLAELLTKMEEDAREARTRVADVSSRDLARQSELTAVRRTVEAIDARRDEVQALRATLDSIRRDVTTAVDVARRIEVNGQQIDFNALEQRLRSVEELRTRLSMPTGELLDAARLEGRLAELTNTFVTEDELDVVLRQRPVDVPTNVLDGIRDSVTSAVRAELQGTVNTQVGDLRAEVDTRFAGIDATVARSVADATPSIREGTLAAIRPEIASAVATAVQQSEAADAGRLANAMNDLRVDVNGAVADVRSSVMQFATQEIARLTSTQIDTLSASVNSLQQQTASIEQRIGGQQSQLQTVATRVEVVARDGVSQREELRRILIGEMDNRLGTLVRDLDRRFLDIEERIRRRTLQDIDEASRILTERVQQMTADAAAAEVRVLTTRLRAEMVAVASDQVTALRSEMQTTVNTAVNDAMRSIPGVVSQEVRRATANVPDLVRAEVNALQPTINTMVANEVQRVNQPTGPARPVITPVPPINPNR